MQITHKISTTFGDFQKTICSKHGTELSSTTAVVLTSFLRTNLKQNLGKMVYAPLTEVKNTHNRNSGELKRLFFFLQFPYAYVNVINLFRTCHSDLNCS